MVSFKGPAIASRAEASSGRDRASSPVDARLNPDAGGESFSDAKGPASSSSFRAAHAEKSDAQLFHDLRAAVAELPNFNADNQAPLRRGFERALVGCVHLETAKSILDHLKISDDSDKGSTAGIVSIQRRELIGDVLKGVPRLTEQQIEALRAPWDALCDRMYSLDYDRRVNHAKHAA